jgi:hypothetical protein
LSDDCNSPRGEGLDTFNLGSFNLLDPAIADLFAQARRSPRGPREFWREVLMEHPAGPRIPIADFEIVWTSMQED